MGILERRNSDAKVQEKERTSVSGGAKSSVWIGVKEREALIGTSLTKDFVGHAHELGL